MGMNVNDHIEAEFIARDKRRRKAAKVDARIGRRGAMDVIWHDGRVTRCEGTITGIRDGDAYLRLDTGDAVAGDVESLEVLDGDDDDA